MMFVVKTMYMICRDLMLTTKTILIADLMFVAEDFVAKNNKRLQRWCLLTRCYYQGGCCQRTLMLKILLPKMLLYRRS
jgi:hypothetical protein